MKFNIKRTICTTLATSMIFSSMAVTSFAEENKLNNINQISVADKNNQKMLAETTVYIVGDSTACVYGYDDNYALPRAGWGMYFGNYLLDKAKVVDLALAGRSSKSFTTEDNYKTLCENLKEGDYLLIQFGHNDAKKSNEEDLANRYTDPAGDTQTDGSFKNSLYNNYIKLAQDKGAIPILLSPISRRKFENGKVTDSHGLYDDAVRELAKETGVDFVDATEITADIYNELGEQESKIFHSMYNDLTKGYDNTHLSHFGANTLSAILAENMDNTSLAKYIVDDPNEVYEQSQRMASARGDIASELSRLIGFAAEGDFSFSDVSSKSDDYRGIYNAKVAGIVKGDENSKFNPDRSATQLETLLMVSRAMQKALNVNSEDIDTSSVDKLVENGTIREYARKDLAYIVNIGLINANKIADYVNTTVDGSQIPQLLDFIYDNMVERAVKETEKVEEQSIDELEKVENTN